MGLLSKIFGSKLIKAVDKGNTAEVESLLNNGSDPNDSQMGITALMTACNRGHKEIAKLLLDKGADPNARDWEGWTALMAASAGSAYDDVRNKEDRCLEIVGLLIDSGADVNQRGKGSRTALKDAEAAGHKRVRDLLVQRGAKI